MTSVAFIPGEWTTVGARRSHVPAEIAMRFPGLSQEAYNVLMEVDGHISLAMEMGRIGADGSMCHLMIKCVPAESISGWSRTSHYQRIGMEYTFQGVTWNPPEAIADGFTDLSDDAWRAIWRLTKAGLIISAKEEISYDTDHGERAELRDLTLTLAGATGAPTQMMLHMERWSGLTQREYS